jgi:hypothetical protein
MKDCMNNVHWGPAPTRWFVATLFPLAVSGLTATVGWTADPKIPGGSVAGVPGPTNGIRVTVLDSAGRRPVKEFQVIAGVRSQAGGEPRGEVVNWQPHTLRTGHDGELVWPLDRAYDEMALRVEAEGYAPQSGAWLQRKKGAQDVVFELSKDNGTAGRVLSPDGQAAAGATVALAMVQRDAVMEGGALRQAGAPRPDKPSDRWRLPRTVQTDARGRFRLPAENDPTAALLILHPTGVRELPLAEFKKAPEVQLQLWGRIEGKVQWGGTVGSNGIVSLTIHRDDYGYPGVIAQYERTMSGEDGTFVLDHILPGRAQLSCPITATAGNKSGFTEISLSPLITHLSVQPGANPALLGGQGRTVQGRLVGRESWNGVIFGFHPPAPHIGFPGDDEMWKAWSAFQKSPAGPLFFREGLLVNPDGTFEIGGVLPGDYQILFSRAGERESVAAGRFVVPPETPDAKPGPLDIGEMRAANKR